MPDQAETLDDQREREADAAEYFERFGITVEEAHYNAQESRGDRQREEDADR